MKKLREGIKYWQDVFQKSHQCYCFIHPLLVPTHLSNELGFVIIIIVDACLKEVECE